MEPGCFLLVGPVGIAVGDSIATASCTCPLADAAAVLAQHAQCWANTHVVSLRMPQVPPPLIERASEQYVVGTGLRVFACSESQKIGKLCGLAYRLADVALQAPLQAPLHGLLCWLCRGTNCRRPASVINCLGCFDFCAGHVTFFWNGNRSGYLNPKLEKFEEVRLRI